MLIIPAEKSVDWRHPPWVTLGLMLTCLLVFLFYQSGDERKLKSAVEQYLQDDLLALEAPAYIDYLERQIRFEGLARSQEQLEHFRALQQNSEPLWQAITLISDRPFYNYLRENQALIWAPAERGYWQEHRSAIEDRWVSRISAFDLGLTPGDLKLHSLITYQFLHGGWSHLIGNLIFLFLLGFTVERALGPWRYLLAYLLCGAISGLVHTAFSWGSMTPLVGASGSIAGLMGMYLAIYGFQKIRFFFYLGVYFNYLKAPAILLLPIWLGREVYSYVVADGTGVAYMAHAGGVVAGAAMVAMLGKSWLQVRDEFFEPEEEEQDARFNNAYAQAMASLGRLDFDTARRQFQALRESHPDRAVLLEHLYQIAKLRPDLPEYHDRTLELMDDAMGRRRPAQMLAVWREYLSKGEAHHPLAPEAHNKVLFASLREQDMKTAEKAFERLKEGGSAELVEEASRLLAAEFEKLQMATKAQKYRQMLPG